MQGYRAGICARAYMLSLAFGLLLGPAPVLANGAPSFVAGDLIVKFTDASESGALIDRALRDEKAAPTALALVATHLSADHGVPLAATRVTSGREIVLSINRDRLARRIMRQVTRDPIVRSVVRVEAPDTVLPATDLVLRVELVPDSEEDMLAWDTAQAGRRSSPEITALAARLAAGVDPKPSGQVDTRGRLLLVLDLAVLTRNLLERIKRRSDVEYAQLSLVVHPFGEPK